MNSPLKEPQVVVPSTTPTLGATIGSVLGAVLTAPAAAVGIPPIVVTPILSGFGAWLAHFLHSKLGTPE
jgi:hypothetical protein